MFPLARRVVLVVVDGLVAEAIDRFSLFNFKRLIARGTSAQALPLNGSDSTASSVLSLMTGVSPCRHSPTTRPGSLPRLASRLKPLAASIGSEGYQTSAFLSQLDANLQTGVRTIGRELGFQHLSFAGSSSADVVKSAVSALYAQPRGLIATHFPDIARAKVHGLASREYKQAVRCVDQSIGVLASLSGAGSGDSLLVVAGEYSSSAETLNDAWDDSVRRMSFILSGKSVSSGSIDGISILDIPATLLWALGLNVPRSYEGRPLMEAFGFHPEAVSAQA